jgi:hypothetical protein
LKRKLQLKSKEFQSKSKKELRSHLKYSKRIRQYNRKHHVVVTQPVLKNNQEALRSLTQLQKPITIPPLKHLSFKKTKKN